MKLLILTAILTTQSSMALDIDKYLNKLKSSARSLLNSGKTEKKEDAWSLPPIPKITQSATDTKVYNKKGKLFNQGREFNQLSLANKRKYRVAFIKELFKVTVNSEIDDDTILNMLNTLEQGGSREGIYRSVVLGQSYLMLENYEEKSSDRLVQFTVAFGSRYLARKFSEEQIKKINLWGIKRIIVEKTLDTLDAFESDGEDLYQWYAILSSELADNYKQAFISSTRRNTDPSFHHRWVQSVPYQQIKSELIIKLHKVMNSLQ